MPFPRASSRALRSALSCVAISACGSLSMGIALVVAYLLGGSHEQPAPPMRSDINGIETSTFATEAQGLAEHRTEAQRLSTYGWVDRDKGVIHVPIDVAFELWLAQRGAQR